MRKLFRSIRPMSQRLVIGILMLLCLFHVSRVLIEIGHLQKEVEQVAVRISPEIDLAQQSKDLFSLRKSLRDLKSDEIQWISFNGSVSKELGVGPLQIGDTQSNGIFTRKFIFPVEYRGNIIGTLNYGISPGKVSLDVFYNNIQYYIGITLFIICIIAIVFFEIFRAISHVEGDLETLADIASGNNKHGSIDDILKKLQLSSSSAGLLAVYSDHLVKVISAITRLGEIERKHRTLEVQASFAKQVAHDIRSPLSALTMVMGTINEIPEEKRILIRNATQRINDIANDLLQKSKENATNNQITNITQLQKQTIEFIPVLVDILVSEKRMQYREYSGLEIQIDLKNSFGAFSKVNSSELKRVVSNLVNNAVEAFDHFKGTVTVGVQKINSPSGLKVEIFVKDNGKGIPAHLINQLGQAGISLGKTSSGNSGSGLGLYHAKQTAESFSGSLEIESSEGNGTIVRILFPIGEAPRWFANEIDLSNKKYLVSLDDDISIHQIWSGRLHSLDLKNIEHLKFQSGEVFEKYVQSHQDQIKDILFLIDYELLNQPKTGLDLIEELGIGKHSILVTSRYEEAEIQSRVTKLNLQILPKSLAGFVPFETKKIKMKYDAVLLDDDSLVHMTWKMSAKNKAKSILCFQTKEELFSKLNEIDSGCPFYIDENLSNGVKGEQVTNELFNLGFKNLYLATGYPADQFVHITWIKGVVGKDPLL